jgi:PTS system mannose-specific IIC component
MTLVDIGIVAMLGGILGLDVVSFPQAMLSRPLVACTVSAGFLGAAPFGLLLGVLVEAFALETLPVGASRYPEWGSSSAVGGALVAREPTLSEASLLVAVVATLATAWVGGWSMVQVRRLNAHWAAQRHEAIARGSRRVVVGLQIFGLSADFLRGAAMTALGLLALSPVAQWARGHWGLPADTSRALLLAVAGIVAVGAVFKVFQAVAHTRWYFAVGLLVSLAVLFGRWS